MLNKIFKSEKFSYIKLIKILFKQMYKKYFFKTNRCHTEVGKLRKR